MDYSTTNSFWNIGESCFWNILILLCIYIAFSLAQNLTIPAPYDSHYLALAEKLSADFYTADSRLFNTVKNYFSRVYLVS